MNSLALLFLDEEDLDSALVYCQESVQLIREIKDKIRLLGSLTSLGLIHYSRKDLTAALSTYKELEKISRELENTDVLQMSLKYQAVIFIALGKFDNAMNVLHEQENIFRQSGNSEGLAGNQVLQSLIQGNKDGILKEVAGLSVFLMNSGKLEEAMKILKEEERISRELGSNEFLSECLGCQAVIPTKWDKLKEAMILFKEKERICLEIGNKDGIYACHVSQATIIANWVKQASLYLEKGDFENALNNFKNAYYNDPNDFLYSTQIGWCYFVLGNFEEAEKYFKISLKLKEEEHTFMNLGHIYLCKENHVKAINYYFKSIKLWENKDQFFSDFDSDYEYLKKHGISKEKYAEIKNELEKF